MMIVRFLGIALLCTGLTACLKTRSETKDAEQRQVVSQQANSFQRENIDVNSRLGDINEEIRDLRGRVEVMENHQSSGRGEADRTVKQIAEQNQDAGRRLALLQESVGRLDAQIQAQNAEILALKAEISAVRATRAATAATAPAGTQNSWEQGLEHFGNKDWKKAILSFQDYREKNPKGKNVPEAVYRMGVAFQELGLRDEARTFYEEITVKFPKSNEAKKARIRLKGLKK